MTMIAIVRESHSIIRPAAGFVLLGGEGNGGLAGVGGGGFAEIWSAQAVVFTCSFELCSVAWIPAKPL